MMLKISAHRRALLAVAVMISASLLAVLPVLGASATDFDASIGCEGFTPNGASIVADRDNTGRGQETIAINAVDGAGNNVFQLVDAVPLNWTVTPGELIYGWSAEPAANPISLSVISLPGNGLPQQVLYSTTGTCEGLATGTATDAAAFASVTVIPAGPITVSPSILPGRDIPVPRTNTDVIEALPFYAIVNTPRLNLRSGDGPQFLPVAVLRGGTRTRILGKNAEVSWWLLEAGGYRGWASAEFLAVRGDATDVPVINDTDGDLIPVTFVTSVDQRVYTEPNNLNVNFLCEIPPSEYVVTGKDSFDVFYQIQARCEDGRTARAWLRSEDGLFRNPAALSLPVLD